ncbi:MAG: GDSL-type esterase/lipase family protein [Candidatus Bathyarchaeota archaeon]|nr:GDSL-type esterase/lipase family protein [Candidatus Bathyarchaeota archaeon]
MTTAKKALLAFAIIILIMSSSSMILFLAIGNVNNTGLIRVACVGDSITEGSGYTVNLQAMLGADYMVGNFGVSGSTVMLNSDKPYMNQSAFHKAKLFQPSIVVIMLGTNDARENVTELVEKFQADYKRLIEAYQTLESNPQIWLVKPPPIFENNLDLSNANLEQDVIPCIDQVANELDLSTIDVNRLLLEHPEYFGDGVHPNSEAAYLIASEISQAVTVNGS